MNMFIFLFEFWCRKSLNSGGSIVDPETCIHFHSFVCKTIYKSTNHFYAETLDRWCKNRADTNTLLLIDETIMYVGYPFKYYILCI